MTSDLRPLGAGEILDRAVTVFVRHFWLLVLILALVAIPIGILAAISQPDFTKTFADLQRVLAVPPGHPEQSNAILEQMIKANRLSATSIIATLLSFIAWPLAITACIIAIAHFYRSETATLAQVYRAATRRWVAQIITLLAFIAIGVGVFVALMIAVFALALVFGIIFGVMHAPRTAGLIIGVLFGLGVFLVGLFATMLVILAGYLAIISIAIEEPDPARAIGRALRRTLAKDMFWRSSLVALIIFAVDILGSLVLVSVAGILASVTHIGAVYIVVVSSGNILINALLACYLVVYSFDVRIRREGYDLALATQQEP
jgi:hypothetical protein